MKKEENLDKLLKGNKEWLHKNETQKTNKILAVLTFFIAIGEISIVTKNFIENPTHIYFISYFAIVTVLILALGIILINHRTKRGKHHKRTVELGKKIMKENYQVFG